MKIFTFLSIIAVFVLIGSVCATDIDNDAGISANDDNEIVNEETNLNSDIDDNQIQSLASNEVDEVSAENTREILSDDNNGTWSELTSEIGTGGDKVLSKKTYTYDSGSTITITTAGVIDGNGAVIDMAGSNIQAFKVNIEGVTFKNLTIKNAYFNDACSAIYFSNSGTLTNCNFINNTEDNKNWDYAANGGAVYFGGFGSVDNCNFISNNALSWSNAAAIYFATSGTVRNSNFTNNKVESGLGGAIFFGSSASVDNCNFINNTGIGSSSGAAVYFTSSGNVTNCNLTNNTATNWGGALYFGDSSSVDNCIFIYNRINSKYNGGAINFNANGTVTNCIFYKNSASNSGGAVFIGGSGIVDNCNFTDNHGDSVSYYGGAVYIDRSGNVTNCNFINSYVCFEGGAVYIASSGNVINCNFTNNTSVDHDTGVGAGGAVYVGSSATVNMCNFIDNHGGEQGGAVWTNNGIVTNCIFNGNTAEDGAVYFDSSGTVTNCYFVNNDAATHGGAVYGFGTVTYCSFVNNSADSQGGAVYGGGTIKYCSFNNNSASEGGVIYFKKSGSAEYCNFTNNSASDGGVIYFNHSATVTNCNFIDNSATNGGAVAFYNSGSVVTNCNFTGNYASENGGAIAFTVAYTMTNCNFEANKASNHGGAIYFSDSGTVTNCNFSNNNAKCGGAIYSENSCIVDVCNFSGNGASDQTPGIVCMGGALCISGFGNVTNSNFTSNSASSYGGAIYFAGSCTVDNCYFKDCTSSSYGGAIYANGLFNVINSNFVDNSGTVAIIFFKSPNCKVDNCNFTGNYVQKKSLDVMGAAALYFASSGTVTNCNFINNTGYHNKYRGGAAIYFDNSGTVKNCNFINNTADGANGGAAIYFLSKGSVTNCIFINNAGDNGGAIYAGGILGTISTCNVINSSFINNSASSNGGAISTKGGTVINCIFINNSAAKDGGAIRRHDDGEVTGSITADTCIFKTDSDTIYNTDILSPTLSVDNFTAAFNSGELTFDLKTNSGMSVYDGNISISVYYKDNDVFFGNYSRLSGEGWTVDLPVGDYYAVFNTEYAEFEAINRTVTVTLPDVQFYINVTSFTSNNKTVNITAKSNIHGNLFIDGKLRFILPNGNELNATYADEGIWWAVHTFDDYDVYNVSASYNKLNNVSINNATVSVIKANSTVNISDVSLDYGESMNVTVTVKGATGITAKINDDNVTVINNFTIPIPGLDAGSYILTVTTIPDEDHVSVTKTVKITVNKFKTELTASAVTTTYNVNKYLVITLKDNTGKALNGTRITVNLNGAKTYTTDKNGQVKINVAKQVPKTYNTKITFNGNNKYQAASLTVKVVVKKAKAKITAKKKTFKKSKKTKKYKITLKSGKTAIKKAKVTIKIKKKTYKAKTNKKGKATFKIKKLTKKGKYKAKITYKGNAYYNKVTKKVKIKIK